MNTSVPGLKESAAVFQEYFSEPHVSAEDDGEQEGLDYKVCSVCFVVDILNNILSLLY